MGFFTKRQNKLYLVEAEQAKELVRSLKETACSLEVKIDKLNTAIEGKQQEINKLVLQLDNAHKQIMSQDLLMSPEYKLEDYSVNDLAMEIDKTKDKLASMIKDGSYVKMSQEYLVDGSAKKGKEFTKAFCENNILGFNIYCEKKRKSLTRSNYGVTIDLIDKAFNRYSKRVNIINASLNLDYVRLVKKWFQLELNYKIAKEEEKERIKEEKRKLREEQQLLAEAEKERKRLEEERKAMDLAFNKALTEAEREEIKNKLAEIDKRIADVDYRVNNPKAGWVYIIHSDSLLGLEKIGVSRRLSGPHERVKELSGSSLPTPFMIDAFCFSDDAFELESNLHKYFDKQRVNPNKEFFRITAQEAINAMENVFNHKAHIVNLENEDNEID